MKNNQEYDVIVIGGGPAGSTAAGVLASKGRRVVLLEKEKFPRYHIGESLIPYTYFPLERLGMIPKMQASHFPRKYSVQFVGGKGLVSQPFYFFKHLDHEAANTWQVLRSEFDQMLLDNTRKKGATVIEEITARDVIRENGAVTGVIAVDKDGSTKEFRAPMTIDATGRDAFLVTRNGWKVRDPYLNKIAIWTYYKGAKIDPGIDAGATTVAYLPEKGWFWYIPLPDDMVSVGIVAEKDYLYKDSRDLETIYQGEIKKNLWIEQHVSVGQQTGPYRVTGEYSYRSKHCASDGLLLVGDAFAFLDPVFSSGVFIALRSGELGADAVDAALTAGDVSAARFDGYGREMCKGIEAMRKLVYAFYNYEFSFRKFVAKFPELTGDMTDCLIGNLLRDFEPLQSAMSEFAKLPENLPHGLPWSKPGKRVAYEFKLTRRVEFSETDMAGIVHFSNFFRYMEAAEHGFFRSLGFSIFSEPIGWPRVHADCDFKSPIRFEDEVEIHLLVRERREKSISYTVIFRKLNGDAVREVARGTLTVACVTRDRPGGAMKSVPIPREIADKIEAAPKELLAQ